MDGSMMDKSASMEDLSDVCDAPPMKKFKQVCLPFKILDSKSQSKGGNKKRKLSDQESPSAKPPKTLKHVVNNDHNIKTQVVENDPEVSSSSEADNLPLKASTKPKTVRSNILEHFVRKSTLEEIEITSTIDVDKCGNDKVDSTNLQTPEKSLLSLKGELLNSNKTSTPKSRLGFTVKKADSNTDLKDKDTSNIDDIVEISDDGDDEKEETENAMEKSMDKSSSLDESKIDLSLLSSPGKSSNGGLDSSVCDTPKSKPKSDGDTGTPAGKKSASKISEKKKQERLRIKEQKEKERMEKKLQKEKELQEKKQKLEEAKLEKEKLKKEEKEKKDREKQEKLEKLEKEKLEKIQQKEEEKRKKQELIDLKMEEKKKKEEEKRMKEEEKKLKEEEKKKEEEERNKKEKKVKAAFEGFFVKQKVPEPQPVEVAASVKTSECIEIKKDTYRVSGIWRILSSTEKQNLDSLMKSSQENCKLYLNDIKSTDYKLRKAGPEQYSQRNIDKDELIIHDSETVKKFTHHVKYIYFHTNYRPPYYGTWRKKSQKLTARNPFKMDQDLLDYEVDSDDEWEEEEPGESLSASEGEDNEEKEENDEDDDGWMVPHGYLSEDECAEDDKEITPENLKDRQRAKADQWEAELKRQCQPVKTVCIGCYWTEEDNDISQKDIDFLHSYAVECITSLPISTILSVDSKFTDTPSRDKCQTPTHNKIKTKPVPEEAMSDLIKLLHGNTLGIKKLMHEFRVYWKQTTQSKSAEETCNSSQILSTEDGESPKVLNESMKEENTPAKEDTFSISKRQLEKKIMAIAVREKRNCYKKVCWHVNEDLLKHYELEELTYPNTWQYITRKNEEPINHDISQSKIDDDANTSVCDENQTPKPLPKDQRSIMDFAKKVDHPPEILPIEKPVEAHIPVSVKPKEVKRIKPTVLSLLNSASQKCSVQNNNTCEKKVVLVSQNNNMTTEEKVGTIPPSVNHSTITTSTMNTVTKQIEPMEYNEDSNGCILLD